MMKCIRKRGFLGTPAGLAVTGVGVLAAMAVQWPLALSVFCEADATPAVSAAAPPAAGASSSAEVQADAIPAATAWREDLDAALQEAAEQRKPVLVYFTADWCPPCQRMKRDVWPREEVRQRLHADYIPVMIDVDLPRHGPVAQRYGIRGIPTILVLNARGEVQQAGGFMTLGAMLAFLDQASGRG